MRKREEPEEIASAAPEDETASLKAALEACSKGGQQHMERYRRNGIPLAVVPMALLMIWLCVTMVLHWVVPLTALFVLFLFLPFWAVGCLLAMIVWRRRTPETERERTAVERLRRIDDPGVAPLLLDHFGGLFALSVHRALEEAIVRLLPRLTEEEILQLGQERHAKMALWISNWKINSRTITDSGVPYLLAILRAMTVVGEDTFRLANPAQTLPISLSPTLRKWAKGGGAGHDPEVRKAAAICLRAIQEKAAQAQANAQLLRASAPEVVEGLLRPAQGTASVEPLELLRPGAVEEPRP